MRNSYKWLDTESKFFETEEIKFRRLSVSAAFHSPQMTEAAARMKLEQQKREKEQREKDRADRLKAERAQFEAKPFKVIYRVYFS